MDEQNKYSGWWCADCGKTMVLHQAHTMGLEWNHVTCRTYKKSGPEICTGHFILNEVVLEDLRQMTAMAREHTWESVQYIYGKRSAETRWEVRKLGSNWLPYGNDSRNWTPSLKNYMRTPS